MRSKNALPSFSSLRRIVLRPFAFLPAVALFYFAQAAAQSASGLPNEESTEATSITFRLIDDAKTLEIVAQIQQRVSNLRGLELKGPLKLCYLDSPTLEKLVRRSFDKTFPPEKRRGVEKLLKSLQTIPEDLDLLEMYLSLLDEQVGGLYDSDSKHLFVREGYDIASSALARLILAHEVCHMLQDQAFDFESLGIETPENDDLATAIVTIAEGDAMLLMSDYAVAYEARDLLKDLPQALTMDQSALQATPHFFQQLLIFPYLQGQIVFQEAQERGAAWRNRLFTDPPQTTEQVIHPEKYFGERDEPAPLALLTTATIQLPEGLARPVAPAGFKRLEVNRMGEIGTRALLEKRLGVGIAFDAAAGWDGDAYAIYAGEEDHWWFCWESVWDSPRDAAEFQGAWITYWRAITGQRKLGSLRDKTQEFQAGDWHVTFSRAANHVFTVWHN